MKMIKLMTFGFLGLFLSIVVYAQDDVQELVVPLSKPGERGTLKVSLMSGTINVSGYDGKDVVISVATEQKRVDDDRYEGGLRRIPNRSLGLTAKENDNYVTVSSSNHNREIKLDIKVPKNFDLKLRGHNDGGIRVENVNGELDIGHHNDDITLMNISGSAIVNSHNGEIKVKLINVTPDTPMAFSTFNGDVDISFPSGLKATLKMKSERGEMLTDFDVDIKKTPPKTVNDKEDGVYKISLEEWVIADVNGGGPEILFKTYNGDIIIRKN